MAKKLYNNCILRLNSHLKSFCLSLDSILQNKGFIVKHYFSRLIFPFITQDCVYFLQSFKTTADAFNI